MFNFPRIPSLPRLVLISASGEGEILSLRELLNLDLTQLHHATLCSCWSADHLNLFGRWTVSFLLLP
ncbi:MAG: CHAT domain-containing protein [Crocosphaera sp.]